MILADNVFEHISNPIRWLMSLEKLLNPNGYIFLCIPEYDQIFDRFRNTTDLGHLVADYFEGVPDLDPRHTVELELFYDMNYVNKPNILEDRLSIKRLQEVYHGGTVFKGVVSWPHMPVSISAAISYKADWQAGKGNIIANLLKGAGIAKGSNAVGKDLHSFSG